MENLFKPGEIVYMKKLPNVKLVIRRFEDDVYCCKVFNHPGNREMSFAENDLIASANPTEQIRR